MIIDVESVADTAMYDIIVVGAGMVGSAAARHLLEINNVLKVALIGPSELQDKDSRDIYASHYDEGRITRVLDPDPVWATLAKRSLQRYRQLEHKSGVQFYHEVGCLGIGYKDSTYLKDLAKTLKGMDEPFQHATNQDLHKQFPYLSTPKSTEGIFTKKDAGHISPRSMVKAQKTVAMHLGCDVIQDIVCDVIQWKNYCTVKTENGILLQTKKVLLCPGSFMYQRNLLPNTGKPLAQTLTTTVILVEIEDEKAKGLMSNMPSIIIRGDENDPENNKYRCYILPPIKYPDGKYYLKIGHGHNPEFKLELKTSNEIKEYFNGRGNTKPVEKHLRDLVLYYFPSLANNKYHYDYCVTCQTESTHMIIDMVSPQIGVAFGGCGHAAKSSDELGYIAARMINAGKWDHDISSHYFKIKDLNSKL